MKQFLGYFLLSLPFLGIFVAGIIISGLPITLMAFGVTGLIALCGFIGVGLIE